VGQFLAGATTRQALRTTHPPTQRISASLSPKVKRPGQETDHAPLTKVKVQLFHYRPLGLQEVEAPRISRQSAHEGGKVVSPMHRLPLSPGDIPGTRFC
jgi:hypothetical protein